MKLAVISVISPDKIDEPRVEVTRKIIEAQGFDHIQVVDHSWVGWSSKLWFNAQMCRKLTDYTHLMYVDARDVVVLGGPEEIIERWKKLDHPWVYSAEPFIWSPGSFEPEDYPTPDTLYRYLNSGAYIGEREHIVEWFERWGPLPVSLPRGDQDFMAQKFIDHYPEAIKLDTNCDLFQSMCGSLVGDEPHCSIYPGKIVNHVTGTEPLIIHFNGGDDITRPNRRILWNSLI